MKSSINFSLKNLTRQKRRNAVLVVAIAFGFFVITAIDGLVTGMVTNLESQITQLIGGNVITQGLEWLPPEREGSRRCFYCSSLLRHGSPSTCKRKTTKGCFF